MAKGVTLIQIYHPDEHVTFPSGTEVGRGTNAAAVFLEKHAGGGTRRTTIVSVGQGTGVAASGTVTFSSASGTVGAIINGVTITVTASGGDTNTAALFATAVNASINALVAGLVTATSALGVATLTAVPYGTAGNAFTLAASGTGVSVSGARFTGGTAVTLSALRR